MCLLTQKATVKKVKNTHPASNPPELKMNKITKTRTISKHTWFWLSDPNLKKIED